MKVPVTVLPLSLLAVLHCHKMVEEEPVSSEKQYQSAAAHYCVLLLSCAQ